MIFGGYDALVRPITEQPASVDVDGEPIYPQFDSASNFDLSDDDDAKTICDVLSDDDLSF